MTESIDFRDAAALQKHLGLWSAPGPVLTVDQASIDTFAELSGDRNWLHVDVERCLRESPFGAPVAHGMLLLSLLPRLSPRQSWQIAGHRQAVNRGLDRVRFLAPLRAGSAVRCRTRLNAITVGDKGTDLIREYQAFTDDPEQPLMAAEFVLRYS
ncbi:MAG: MaoC family dehydratase N-terminal domain-containing protein [Proteobacteria bacterium]|nr:MaoC family dehydratase N-terminal domain-containing protein [Pseudomonadota bacterium]HQR02770.1 MaoC/PaaZ C-terminal domain-containing protein [Rhodocyclaceae bacterium]